VKVTKEYHEGCGEWQFYIGEYYAGWTRTWVFLHKIDLIFNAKLDCHLIIPNNFCVSVEGNNNQVKANRLELQAETIRLYLESEFFSVKDSLRAYCEVADD